MKTCVVSEHEWGKVELPIEHGVMAEESQIFCNGFITNFCLAVAMGVVRRGSEVIGAQPFEQFV